MESTVENRRSKANNIPYGLPGMPPLALRPKWDNDERERRLRNRMQRIAWGKIISVVGSLILIAVDVRTNVGSVEIRMAVMEAKQLAQQSEIQRLWSYWGAPPPRNAGQ